MFQLILSPGWPGQEDFTKELELETVRIEDSLKVKSDSLAFSVVVKEFEKRRPIAGEEVEFRHYGPDFPPLEVLNQPAAYLERGTDPIYGDYTIEFKGVIVSVTQTLINPRVRRFDCEANDFMVYFDRMKLKETIAPNRAGHMIHDILKLVQENEPEFVPAYTYVGPEIAEEKILDYQSPSEAIDEIVASVGGQWYVDYNKRVYFFQRLDLKSPFLPQDNILDADEELNYFNLEFKESIENIANMLFITDAKSASFRYVYEESFGPPATADEILISFPLSARPKPPPKTLVGGVDLTKASVPSGWFRARIVNVQTGVKTDLKVWAYEGRHNAAVGDLIVNYEREFIYLNRYALRTNERLEVEYRYAITGDVFWYWDAESITHMWHRRLGDLPRERVWLPIETLVAPGATPQRGVFQKRLSEPAIWVEDELQAIEPVVEREFRRNAYPEITGKFYTYLRGWKAGMNFKLRSKMHGDFYQTPMLRDMIVTKVIKRPASHERMISEIYFMNAERE